MSDTQEELVKLRFESDLIELAKRLDSYKKMSHRNSDKEIKDLESKIESLRQPIKDSKVTDEDLNKLRNEIKALQFKNSAKSLASNYLITNLALGVIVLVIFYLVVNYHLKNGMLWYIICALLFGVAYFYFIIKNKK